jgi:hypothetical protein
VREVIQVERQEEQTGTPARRAGVAARRRDRARRQRPVTVYPSWALALGGAMLARTGLSNVFGEDYDRTHENLMPELLARSTTPEVHQAPDRRGVRGSIDHFFRSMTDDEHGIGRHTIWNRH